MVRVNATGHQREPTASPTWRTRSPFSLMTSHTLVALVLRFSLSVYRIAPFSILGFRISNRNPLFMNHKIIFWPFPYLLLDRHSLFLFWVSPLCVGSYLFTERQGQGVKLCNNGSRPSIDPITYRLLLYWGYWPLWPDWPDLSARTQREKCEAMWKHDQPQ